MLLLATLVQCCAGATPSAMICPCTASSNYWKVPHEINCSKILQPWTPKARLVELDIFRPNTIRYHNSATVCKIITQKVIYWVNFFGARNKDSVSTEKIVSPEECKQMIRHKTCAYGELAVVGTVVKTQNLLLIDWPTAPFSCCRNYGVTVTNCVSFKTSAYEYHGSSSVESPIGPLPGCQYEDDR
ncbi:hypothetical protein GCK32_001621 [Trichostrongylus colubriformis]|uniref:Uncharacterized protein n=1 Tax=Trichostrongylus colubriformis TaxID=6319 RepID=A0AAN8FHS9_TRICO